MKKTDEIIQNSLEKLMEEVKQGKSENIIKYLEFCSKFYNYSINNTLLIYDQMPNATKVAGMKKWNELGFKIKKGSKAIKILAPRQYVYIDSVTTGEKIFYNQMTKEQKANKELHQKGITFIVVSVFDKSQCNKVDENVKDNFFEGLGDSHEKIYKKLKKSIEDSGIKVVEKNETKWGAEGISYGGVIEIKENQSNNKLITLIHEMAHELLDHGKESDRENTTREQRELRAEASSYIVSNYVGLENTFSSDYIQCWGNSIEDIKNNMEKIQNASKKIISLIESKEQKCSKTEIA